MLDINSIVVLADTSAKGAPQYTTLMDDFFKNLPPPIEIRTIGQIPTVYTLEEEMGHTAVRDVAELLMAELLDDLKTQQDGRTFTITDWKNLSVGVNRMYDAWLVTGAVELRYNGILSPIGDSNIVPQEEYVALPAPMITTTMRLLIHTTLRQLNCTTHSLTEHLESSHIPMAKTAGCFFRIGIGQIRVKSSDDNAGKAFGR